VNGRTLSRTDLDRLATDPLTGETTTDGSRLRGIVSEWITLTMLLDRQVSTASGEDLDAALTEAKQYFVDEYSAAAAQRHDNGFDGADYLCLAVIPIADDTDAVAVISDIEDGTTFADAAAEWSVDPSFAQSGGVVTDQNGQNCVDAMTFGEQYAALGIVDQMSSQARVTGAPVLLTLEGEAGTERYIAQLRPFTELSLDEQLQIASVEIGAEIAKIRASADVWVASRIGTWDPESGAVVGATGG